MKHRGAAVAFGTLALVGGALLTPSTDLVTLLLWAGGLFVATFGSYLLGYRQGRKGARA